MKNNVQVAAMSMALLLSAGAVQAAEVPPERAKVMALIQEVTRDEARHKAAIYAGEERISSGVCAQCHGPDGNSKMEGVPHLAGQNPAYMLEQWEKFADGRRKNFVMQSLSRSFTTEEKVNVSVFFAAQRPKPELADPALAREGARIFQNVCKMCHGDDGRGEEGYARLAGQRADYVVLTLKRFRENAKQRVGTDDMKRHDLRMEQVTQNLSDRDIDALAAYIALLR